jgi:Fic family protein
VDPDGQDADGFFTKLQNLHDLRLSAHSIIMGALQKGSRFVLSEEMVKGLHRTCMYRLLDEAGEYRSVNVALRNSPYVPPNYSEVPIHMEQFCKYVNTEWDKKDLIHLAAFCLWRLNWIHPFRNGNGRISREVAYIILNARSKQLLPSRNSIVEQISSDPTIRRRYDQGLRMADSLYGATNNFDQCVKPLGDLLAELLKNQIRANLA